MTLDGSPAPAVVAVPVSTPVPPFVRALGSPGVFPITGAICALIGLGFAVRLKSPNGLLIGAYTLAVFYSLRIAALALARRFVPACSSVPLDVPITARVALRGRPAWVVPLAALGLLTAIREGAFGAGVAFDVSLQHFNASHRWTSNSSYNWQATGAGRTFLRALPVHCIKPGPTSAAADIVDGFNGFVACDTGPAGAGSVTVTFTLQTSDAWCYAPLIKVATIPYALSLSVAGVTREGEGMFNGNGNLAITGQVSQSMYGIASCRAFNNAVGRRIAADALGVLNGFLREN